MMKWKEVEEVFIIHVFVPVLCVIFSELDLDLHISNRSIIPFRIEIVLRFMSNLELD